MTHSADIKRIKEDLQKLNSESLTIPDEKRKGLLEQDIEIVVNSHYKIGEEDKRERLANLNIWGYSITQKELDVLTEALKMVYMNHQDGEIKMTVKQNYEHLNC